jgi:hypothetical protein
LWHGYEEWGLGESQTLEIEVSSDCDLESENVRQRCMSYCGLARRSFAFNVGGPRYCVLARSTFNREVMVMPAAFTMSAIRYFISVLLSEED